jgi:cholestenol delta-isomerase
LQNEYTVQILNLIHGKRIRHVKCDETKPTCTRCHQTGRTCDGYRTLQKSLSRSTSYGETHSPSAPGSLPALPTFDDPRQRELFAYFVYCASDASNLYFGANFWARRVLQLSLSEASIRYALCSLSALQCQSTIPPLSKLQSDTFELHNYALQQYNNAVRCTQTLLAESSDGSEDKLIKGLVACALFVCYENFTGNYQMSHMHLQNGLHIITRESRKRRHFRIPKDIIQVFKRLDLQAVTFSDSRVPYPNRLWKEPIELLLPSPPAEFSPIEDYIDVVSGLSRWMFDTAALSESCPILSEDHQSANRALSQWNLDLSSFSTGHGTKTKEQLQRPIALLEMYRIIMDIIIAVGVHRKETLHDDYLHSYKHVLALGEGLVRDSAPASRNQFFCFDIGIIFPLFWVAIKCRDPATRRRSLKLLFSLHHQEGAWKSITAAKAAEFVIGVEEEGLESVVNQWQVPEEKRVHLVNATADAETGEVMLSCLMREDRDGGIWYFREGQVSCAEGLLSI